MLRKLMKHELRATARLMLPLYLLVLVLAAGTRISLTFWDMDVGIRTIEVILDVLAVLVTVGFSLALVAVFVVALVLTIQRFRSNLLGDEGYVMFTLPVSVHKLVWAKLLVSTLWFAGAAVVDLLGMLLMQADRNLFHALWEFFPKLLEMCNGYVVGHGLLAGLELVLLCVVLAFNLCLSFYAPLSMGHSFDRHKMLLSVVFFFALETAFQIVGSVLFLGVGSVALLDPVGRLLETLSPEMILHAALWMAILGVALSSAVLYVINHLMLTKRLNLE